MARFQIAAEQHIDDDTVTFHFTRYDLTSDAEFFNRVIADPSFNPTLDTGTSDSAFSELTVPMSEVNGAAHKVLSVCFQHLRDHAGMTDRDSFVYIGWSSWPRHG